MITDRELYLIWLLKQRKPDEPEYPREERRDGEAERRSDEREGR